MFTLVDGFQPAFFRLRLPSQPVISADAPLFSKRIPHKHPFRAVSVCLMDHAAQHAVKLFRLTALDREVCKPFLRDISLIESHSASAYFRPPGTVPALFILQAYERQPACWDRRTCCRPVFLLQNLLHLLRRVNAHADLNQRPGDDPDHIVEETVSRHADRDDISFFFHITGIDRAHRRLYLCTDRTKNS